MKKFFAIACIVCISIAKASAQTYVIDPKWAEAIFPEYTGEWVAQHTDVQVVDEEFQKKFKKQLKSEYFFYNTNSMGKIRLGDTVFIFQNTIYYSMHDQSYVDTKKAYEENLRKANVVRKPKGHKAGGALLAIGTGLVLGAVVGMSQR